MSTTAEGARIALYGGAFDPPHVGHVAFCAALAAAREFSRIWVLPCYRHPFGKELAPFADRLEMCRIAFAALSDKVIIRDDERHTGGAGFTIDLIRYLTRTFPGEAFTLVLGADNYRQRHKWKDFDELQRLLPIRFFGRRGFREENEELGLDTPFPEVSSSELRAALESGESTDALLPAQVSAFIRRRGLYRRAQD